HLDTDPSMGCYQRISETAHTSSCDHGVGPGSPLWHHRRGASVDDSTARSLTARSSFQFCRFRSFSFNFCSSASAFERKVEVDSGVIGERRLSQWGRSKEEVREIFSSRPFLPPPWLRSGHLQTLAASRWVRQFPWGWTQSTRLLLDLRDGSRVSAVTVVRNPGAPTVVAFHGMGGSSQSSYMLAFSHKAYSLGWNAVLVDLYNVNFQLDRPKIFHAG